MTGSYPIYAAIFDMDGLLIDSEPLWHQAERDVFATLDLDVSRQRELPDTTGLRIDMVVDLWAQRMPWQGPSKATVMQQIIDRVITLIEQQRPLLPGVQRTLQQCQESGLRLALASASPYAMVSRVLELFDLRHYFEQVVSAENLPYSKPHPQVYLNAASALGIAPVHCVTFEDSIPGMIASKAAMMYSIVVPAAAAFDDPRWALADQKLRSLDDFTPSLLAVADHPV